jgi:predicted nucleic acid-binding protein
MTGRAGGTAAPLVVPGRVPRLYLDANILLPEYLRTVFLDLADEGLVRVHWSRQVLAEVRRNLSSPKFGLSPESTDRLLAEMTRAFPDALVVGGEKLEPMFEGKTDPKDAHVAAGALKLSRSVYAGKDVLLVTGNLRHLPESAFVGLPVRPVRPDSVLKDLLAANAEVAIVLARMLARFDAPRVAKADLLDILDASNCSGFATALGKAWGLDTAA